MKKILLAVFLFGSTAAVWAQNNSEIHTSSKGSYIIHTVAAKEGLYAIGRKYDVPPKEIAAFNDFDINTPLSLGQTIKIPVAGKAATPVKTTAPVVQNTKANTTAEATGSPIYYTVETSEGLYRVSAKNGNVPMADIRRWNNLTSDALTAGQQLIVGYSANGKTDGTTVRTKPSVPPEPKKGIIDNKKPAAEPKKEVAKNDVYDDKEDPSMQVTKKTETVINKPAVIPVVESGASYFKAQYDVQSKKGTGKDETVTSGIFKTASGWQDAKYYALIDGVEPGTIIRVVNPTNNKSVYAKVLGEMSGIRQNAGMELRISNAAASALQITDMDKFIVKVAY